MPFSSPLGLVSVLVTSLAQVRTVSAESTFSPLRPPAIPLAVVSPYVNTWLQHDTLPNSWPTFWTGAVQGWQGLVNVDGAVYNWMGGSPLTTKSAVQTAFSYTATRSIFTFDVADKVQMNVTFLSPVYPDDLVKKSLQSSYVDVSVAATDGQTHRVSVYMDISGEWISGDAANTVIQWKTGVLQNVAYHQFWVPGQAAYQEQNDQAAWGDFFLATTSTHGLSYQIGTDNVVRGQFIGQQVLDNTVDTKYRAVNLDWPVFAFAHDLGTLGATAADVQFGLGLSQNTTIQYQGAGSGPQNLMANWRRRWSDGAAAMADWINGYAAEAAYSTGLDTRVFNDASGAGGADYASIATLGVRQAFGALQPGYGPTQSYLFLKEISSNGDTSTVDVIYPTFPILAYMNISLVKLLLDPLYENQESGGYPNTYAEHDLGRFPNALGYPTGNDEGMPVEECGNMVIMTLAYAQRSGDTSYLTKHYARLRQWTSYLVQDSLIPSEQLSTDDFAGKLANQTNLALKGIIGIAAMGKIAQLTGQADTYTATAQRFIAQWYTLGLNKAAQPPHATLQYHLDDSHGLLYNLWADRMLSLHLVNQSVYDIQSSFYPTVNNVYGVPLDTRHTYTKLDWEAWVAALASDDTRRLLYRTMANWLTATSARVPMTDLYNTDDGTAAGGFKARPVVGGIFAQLALPST